MKLAHSVLLSPWTFWAFTLYLLAEAVDDLHSGYSYTNLLLVITASAISLVTLILLVVRIVKDEE